MKRLVLLAVFAMASWAAGLQAADTLRIHNTVLPVMPDRDYNVVAEFCIDNTDAADITVNEVKVKLGGDLLESAVRNVSLVYTGTHSPRSPRRHFSQPRPAVPS